MASILKKYIITIVIIITALILPMLIYVSIDYMFFFNSRSDGYKAVENLVKSKQLVGMNYSDVVELLSEYGEQYNDVGHSEYYKQYDKSGSTDYYIICWAGFALPSDGRPIIIHELYAYFDENDTVVYAEIIEPERKGDG